VTSILRRAAAVIAVLAAVQPALAATARAHDDAGWPAARECRTGAVLGAYVRVPLGGQRAKDAPHAGLRMGLAQRYVTPGAPEASARFNLDALDLRFTADQAPTLHFAGTEVGVLRERMLRAGAEEEDGFPWTPVLIGAGVLVAAAGGAFIWWVDEMSRHSD